MMRPVRRIERAEQASAGLLLLPPVAGGASRQASVRAGLLALEQRAPELTALDSWLQAEREIWGTMAAVSLEACSSAEPRSF